jgi:GT2 family glycosyltransferase
VSQPRIRGNDWKSLAALAAREWTPQLRVSVVIPAYRTASTLPFTLGALGAQSYPPELVEVIVVDDAGEGVEVPADAPASTRVVRREGPWGRANAFHTGVMRATGHVIHRLDGDMVPLHDEVERHMRWHHLLDHAVVLGHKTFVDPDDVPAREDVVAAVRAGRVEELLEDVPQTDHEWVERYWRETDDLTTSGFRAYQVAVGASTSFPRALYLACGGTDTRLKLGEDIELGYRLQLSGAVFVADRRATSVHLGPSTLMRRQLEVERYNAPHIAQRVPDLRKFRRQRGRSYEVPFVEVVVDVDGRAFEEVAHTVDAVLRGRPADIVCSLVGPWSRLQHDDRRDPLLDAELDLRLVHEEYRQEGRVRLVEGVAPSAFPAPYRLHLPCGWAPDDQAVGRLLLEMREEGVGLWTLACPDGRVGRLECTAALTRARHVAEPGEEIDAAVAQISEVRNSDVTSVGFRSADEVAPRVAPGDATAPFPADDPALPRKLRRRALPSLRSSRHSR